MLLTDMLANYHGRTRTVYFVNAHTLNVAAANGAYRHVLNRADYVFGDGTGLRWAARLQKVRIRDNLCGTDLVPQLMRANSRRKVSLLSRRRRSTDDRLRRPICRGALRRLDARRPSPRLHPQRDGLTRGCPADQRHPARLAAGRHGQPAARAMDRRPSRYAARAALPGRRRAVPLLGRRLEARPGWLRRLGAEWLGILLQQPHK